MTAPTPEGVYGGWGIRDRGRALSVQVRTVPEFTKAPIFKNLILIKKSVSASCQLTCFQWNFFRQT